MLHKGIFTKTVAVFSDGVFSTRRSENWMKEIPIEGLFPGESFTKSGVSIGEYPNDLGFVIVCRPSDNAPIYTCVWCPRRGDVMGYLMGPALAFMQVIQQEQSQTDLYKALGGIEKRLSEILHAICVK